MASCLVGAQPLNSVLVKQRLPLLGLFFSVVDFFVCFNILLAEIHDLHKPPKIHFWWTAEVLAAALVSCN